MPANSSAVQEGKLSLYIPCIILHNSIISPTHLLTSRLNNLQPHPEMSTLAGLLQRQNGYCRITVHSRHPWQERRMSLGKTHASPSQCKREGPQWVTPSSTGLKASTGKELSCKGEISFTEALDSEKRSSSNLLSPTSAQNFYSFSAVGSSAAMLLVPPISPQTCDPQLGCCFHLPPPFTGSRGLLYTGGHNPPV